MSHPRLTRARIAVVSLSLAALLIVPTAAYAGGAVGLRCADTAATTSLAVAIADACGKNVEVTGERTSWNTTYAQPDGRMRLEVSAGAVRTRVHGSWQAVNRSLVSHDDRVEVVSPVNPMTFSGGGTEQPLARIERDGHALDFDVPFSLPRPEIDGAQLTYASVMPGVDLVVTVNADATGFSEVLRVDSPEAAANPALRELEFPLETSAGLDVVAAKGGFEARDSAGASQFTSPAPSMWDSSTAPTSEPVGASLALMAPAVAAGSSADIDAPDGDLAPADPRTVSPLGAEKQAEMATVVDDDAVTITPDADILASPTTTWPVYIDPSVSGTNSHWAAVRDIYSTKWDFADDEPIGICSESAMGCPATYKSRLIWQFSGLSTIGALASSADVTSASFQVDGVHSYSCTAQPVSLYRVNAFTSSVDWSGGFTGSALDTLTVAHKPACSNDRFITFDATGAAQTLAAASSGSSLYIGLKVDETSMKYWKRYVGSTAKLSVTYNRAPNTPATPKISSPSVACGGVVNSATPTLSGVVSDPDKGNVQAKFALTTSSGTAVWSATAAAKASGSTFTATVASGKLADGGAYKFTVQGIDTAGRTSTVSAACAFTADTAPPGSKPTVNTVAGQAATYTENIASGGINLQGGFLFGNGGVSDVVSYKYNFDDTALTKSATAGTSVFWSPKVAGKHTLYVQSVDKGGLLSPRKDYIFWVANASSAGLWLFNDGDDASTAADASAAFPHNPNATPHELTLSSTYLKVAGADPNAENDAALQISELGDGAWSDDPLVRTGTSFSVGAFVNLNSLAGNQTAVSQDGFNTSAFELGYRTGSASSCPTGVTGCWAFTMNGADSATAPAAVVAASSDTVSTGTWTYLFATYDASARTASLTVCDPNTGVPHAAASKAFTSPWFAVGSFEIGRGLAAGDETNPLNGAVDNVRLVNGVVASADIARYCSYSQVD